MRSALHALVGFLARLQSRAVQNRRFTLGFTAAALLASLALLPRLRVELNFYDSSAGGLSSLDELKEMRARFLDGDTLLVTLRPRAPATFVSEDQLCHIADWLREESQANLTLAKISSPFSLKAPALKEHRLSWSSLIDLHCESPRIGVNLLSALRESPWYGIASDGNDFSFELTFAPPVRSGIFGNFEPSSVAAVVDHLKTGLSVPQGLDLVVGGQAAILWHLANALERDNFFNLAALVLILLALRFFLGTWASGLWFSAVTILSTTLLLGLMAASGAVVDVLNNSLFVILCIAGLEDLLFLSIFQLRRPQSGLRAFRRLLAPGFFTSLTTVLGFGSLLVSRLEIIRRFGLWAAVGSLLEFAAVYLLLPCLLRSSVWVNPAKARGQKLLERAAAWCPPRIVTLALVALAVLSLAGLGRLRVEDYPDRMFPPEHPQSQFYRLYRESRGWEGSFQIVVPDSEKATLGLERRLEADPNVARVLGPSGVMDFLAKNLEAPERSLLRTFSRGAPFFSADDHEARIAVHLKSIALSDLDKSLSSAKAVCGEDCAPTGELVVFHEFVGQISRTLFESLSLSLLLVGATILFLARALRNRRPWRLLVASFWSPVALLGLLAALGIPVNMVNSVFAAVLVGLTGDNAVHFLFGSRGLRLEAGLNRRGGAAVLLALVMAAVSLLFCGMTLLPMRRLGALLATGFLFSVAGDLWILRGLLPKK